MSKETFTGSGFSREPFTADETAIHREMHRFVSETRDTVKSVHDVVQGGRTLVRVTTVCAILGGAVAWAIRAGLI